jgi:hypothetical protein
MHTDLGSVLLYNVHMCFNFVKARAFCALFILFLRKYFAPKKKVKECEYKNVDECIETGWIMHGVLRRGMRVHKL